MMMFVITMNINYYHGANHDYFKQNRISGKDAYAKSGTVALKL